MVWLDWFEIEILCLCLCSLCLGILLDDKSEWITNSLTSMVASYCIKANNDEYCQGSVVVTAKTLMPRKHGR